MKFTPYQWIIGLFFMGYCFPAGAQLSNPCGVVASISPAAADSVVPVDTEITFSSTSVNATSVKWLYNGLDFSSSSSLINYQIKPGIHRISLVAYNGNCTDTTSVVYFSAGTPHNDLSAFTANYGSYQYNEESTCIDKTADGGFVFGGVQYLYAPLCGEAGVLVKTRDKGCIDWSKKFLSPYYCNNSKVTNVKSTADGHYFVVTNDMELAKLDINGNLLWNKKYTLNGYPISLRTINVDPEGAVYAVSNSLGFGWMITKLDKNGTLLWNKYFRLAHGTAPDSDITDFINPKGVVWLKGKLYVGGYVSRGQDYFNFMTGLDATTGAREWQYGYKDPEFPGSAGFTSLSLYDTLLMATSGAQGQTVTLINSVGTVVKNIKTSFVSSYGPKVSKAVADSKGHIYMMQWTEKALNLQPYYSYATNFAEIDTALNKYGGTVLSQYQRGYFNDAVMGSNDVFGAVGINFGFVDDALSGSRDLYLLKTDALKNTQFCDNSNDNTYTVLEKTINRLDFQYLSDSSLTIENAEATPYSVADAYLQSRYTCPDYIDSCSFISISGAVNLCNFSDVYTYRLHRNKKCILSPQWDLPPGVTVVKQTDSSLSVKFPGFGVYKLSASLNSCIPVKDSLTVSIVSKSDPLNLGADTSICPGNSVTLHAGSTFFAYQWNDGSTDSILIAKEPGQYFVKVTDSCSNVFRDTIHIMSASLIPLAMGGDRIKCNDDTLHLNARDGFSNYKWFPDYNIVNRSTQNVVVFPSTDTSYIVTALNPAGCTVSDTIHVSVNHSPDIFLGNDTSICKGQSITLQVPQSFRQYEWSTGALTPQIVVNAAGTYSVAATDLNGCISRDTLIVKNVYDLPVFSLGKDTALCEKQYLDHNFNLANASYLWNDGTIAPGHRINSEGKYWLKISQNGCSITDTISVSYKPLPVVALGRDTTLCEGTTLVLDVEKAGATYLWQDLSKHSTFTVSRGGTYYVSVTKNNCSNSDSITITNKSKPSFSFNKADEFICFGQNIKLSPETRLADNYLWQDNSTDPWADIDREGTYTLSVSNECGIFTKSIVVTQGNCQLDMPNAFTPNNDGLNDIFGVKYPQFIKQFHLVVFNRFGQKVFETYDVNKGWNGTFKSENQPAGTYAWMISLTNNDGKSQAYKGTVRLIR